MKKTISSRSVLRLIVSGSLLFYAMSGLASVLNYAVYPVLSRLLTIQDYGQTQFLLTTFNQLSFGFVVLNILAIILTVAHKSNKKRTDALSSLIVVAGMVSLMFSLVGAVILLLFAQSLQITSAFSVILLAVSFVLNVPFTIIVGKLQGENRFLASGIVSFIATLGKFLFTVIFVSMGFGVIGVMAGVACGMLSALLVGVLITGKLNRQPRLSFKEHVSKLALLKSQAVASTFAVLFITFLSGIDLIASRLLLSSSEAGLYAVVATLAKISIAACSPLVWLALPGAVSQSFQNVRRFTYIGAFICLIFTLPLIIEPVRITTIFMSVDPRSYAALLPLVCISMCFYALSFITLSSLAASKELRSLYASIVSSIGVFIVVAIFLYGIHGSIVLQDVLLMQLVAGVVLFITSFYPLLRNKQ